ncbi:hypothetical protein KBB89_03940 [Candidatus Gracilibacteria bacterium]|nr:hypothetical protein [Candidatus Gracilibacteria bacterium]
MTPSVCESCPLAEPLSLIELFPTNIQGRVREMIDTNHGDQLFELLMTHSIAIFQGIGVSSDTIWAVQQRITTIWELGNQNMGECSHHHMSGLYTRMRKGPFCMRKYMFEQAIAFFKKLWQESNNNEEQFQALLIDRWPVFLRSLTC